MRELKPRLNITELAVVVGISVRTLTRLHQQGFITAIEPRRGLPRGRGTTRLEFSSATEVPKLDDLKILREKFKDSIIWRFPLWLKYGNVRIAPDLAKRSMDLFRDVASKIKTLDDVETLTALIRLTDIPRSNPLRKVFEGLKPKEIRALMTMLLCFGLGIRLPLFDNEPNPYAFQVFKRVLELPEEWRMPPGLFDLFPCWYEQIIHTLRTATPSELEAARRVFPLFLDRVLGEGEVPKWQFVAPIMGIMIFAIRGYTSIIAKVGVTVLDPSVYDIYKLAVSGPSPAGNANACR